MAAPGSSVAVMTDWGELYREHVAAVAALAGTLTEEQLATTVPGTPAWTVHDVLAPPRRRASDAVTGRMDGAPDRSGRRRHVERAGAACRSPTWSRSCSRTRTRIAEAVAGSPRPALVCDIAVHHADLHEALDLPRMPERLWLLVAESLRERSVTLADDACAPYELFRASFSRRSRGQMLGWGTALTAEELDQVCIFGPREDDQPVPA